MSNNQSGLMLASFNSKTRNKQKFNPTHAEVEMAIAKFIKDGGVIKKQPDEIACAVDATNFKIMRGFTAEDFSVI